MLIANEIKIKLHIIGFISFQIGMFEQFVDIILDQQRVSEDAHDFNNRTTNLVIIFDNTNKTICDDGNMYLNADSVLTLAPKGLDIEVLFPNSRTWKFYP